jgi:class 3 adenylate cyclase
MCVVRKQNPHNVDLSLLPIFNMVSADLLKKIGLEMMRFYQDGDVILAEGDKAEHLVVLLHGQVRVFLDGIFLVTRFPYAVLGEQAFINETTRSATVLAQGLVQALVLPRSLVEQLLKDIAFLGNLLRLVSEKLIEASNERAFRFRNEYLLFSEFSAHLSPEITSRLLATGRVYGEPRYIDAIILFSDIRSFTERSARMTPQEIASQLGPYLDATVNLIHQHEGLVDKFIGDAVMAIWGFASSEGDPVTQAFTCAQEMLCLAQSMHFGGAPIGIGVGLNAGQVFIGNIGGAGKRQFTVLGSPVNLAARFESETKVLGAPLVVGKDFFERLPHDHQATLVPHENQTIKGAEPQTLFTYSPVSETGKEEIQ